ncbi:hypothetical protein G9A89_016737 [Geosiphon pyriformis]|nr:hypothetical protein G9A89_016737 [Geosiphon pyriformis]
MKAAAKKGRKKKVPLSKDRQPKNILKSLVERGQHSGLKEGKASNGGNTKKRVRFNLEGDRDLEEPSKTDEGDYAKIFGLDGEEADEIDKIFASAALDGCDGSDPNFDSSGSNEDSDYSGENSQKGNIDIDKQELNKKEMKNKLTSFIYSLDKKRKRNQKEEKTQKEDVVATKKRKRFIEERTEAYSESEFHIIRKDALTSGFKKGIKEKIEIGDLLNSIKNETGFSSLKQKVAQMEGGSKGNSKEPVAPPLPQRIQDKLNREAAYEETKKEITKWEPIVKKIQQVEHLSFPLDSPDSYKPSNYALASTFKPYTELEKQVQDVLIESGVQEKDLQAYEELELNKLSVEEIQARRQELRKMRDLMFREEIKAKRVAKIKSKTYHRIKKKEKERNNLDVKQLIALDPELGRQEHLKLEAARAQERMTLKHKNTSKWAKQALKHGHNDLTSRQAIIEQLKTHEKLKKRILDFPSDEEEKSNSDGSEFEEGENDDDIETVKAKAFDELAQMEERSKGAPMPTKGLFNMKFMKNAMEKQKQHVKEVLQGFTEDLENDNFSDMGENSGEDRETPKEKNQSLFNKVGNNSGRLIISTRVKKDNTSSTINVNVKKNDIKDNLHSSNNDSKKSPSNLKSVEKDLNKPKSKTSKRIKDQEDIEEESNPWLQVESKVATSSKKINKGIVKGSQKSEKLVAKLKKKKTAPQNKELEINPDILLTIGGSQESAKSKNPKIIKASSSTDLNLTSHQDEDSQDDLDLDYVRIPNTIVHAKSPAAFTQRELVARAFANDNVVEDFEAEKQAIIEEDSTKEDLTLPGWGIWVGKGVKKKSQKNLVLKKPLPGEGVDAAKRQDGKLKHVIINEKRIKKATKYLATKLPHPYETCYQYEKSLLNPLGKEWNTHQVFQKIVKPRIITKMGAVIEPLEKPVELNE